MSTVKFNVLERDVEVYAMTDDVESWLSDNYKNYDSNCSYMITKKGQKYERDSESWIKVTG